MADEETIVIRVNAAQGEAALKSLGAAGIQASKDVAKIGESGQSITDKYAALGAKIIGITKVLAAAGDAVKAVAVATGNYSGATKDAVDQIGKLTSSVASFDLSGTAAAMGQLAGQTVAWAQGLAESNVQLGEMVDKKAVDQFAKLLKVQQDLVENHKQETAALDAKTAALLRETDFQQQSGEVQEYIKRLLEDTINAYEKRGEAVPPKLAAEAAALFIVSDAQEKVRDTALKAFTEQEQGIEKVRAALDGDSAARTENTNRLLEGIKRVEEHGDVTVKSAAKIQAALSQEIDLYKQYGDDVPSQLQAVADKYNVISVAQEKVIANAQQVIADIDAAAVKANQDAAKSSSADAAKASADDLRKKIKEIEDQPVFGVEQQNQLDDMKNALLDATRAAKDANSVFTVTADNFLTDAEAAAKYAAEIQLLGDAQDFLAQEHRKAIAATDESADSAKKNADALAKMEQAAGDAGGSFTDLSGSAEDAADSMSDIASAAKDLGTEGKKGGDKAKEGLEGLIEQQETAKTNYETLIGLAQTLASVNASISLE